MECDYTPISRRVYGSMEEFNSKLQSHMSGKTSYWSLCAVILFSWASSSSHPRLFSVVPSFLHVWQNTCVQVTIGKVLGHALITFTCECKLPLKRGTQTSQYEIQPSTVLYLFWGCWWVVLGVFIGARYFCHKRAPFSCDICTWHPLTTIFWLKFA